MVKIQQDSAPAHRTREIVELLLRETVDCIIPIYLWLSNRPDVTDSQIWPTTQERGLKRRLLQVWCNLDQDIIDTAIDH